MFNRYGKFIENADMPLSERYKYVDNSDVTLKPYENVVEVASDSSAVTVKLPDAGEAAGVPFDIHCLNGTTNAVTVNDSNGNNVTSSTVSVDNGYVMAVSNGLRWRVLSEKLS